MQTLFRSESSVLHPVYPTLQEVTEGYVYPVYGDIKYLKFAIASIHSLRRYDVSRRVALACEPQHEAILNRLKIRQLVDDILILKPEHRSIVGFKHNVHAYACYDRTIFLDVDMIFCRKPDQLWRSLSAYPFTVTGSLTSDPFFGGPKGISVVIDILLQRRKRTLKTFGLNYLSRVQSGVMYVEDKDLAREVGNKASWFLANMEKTHFRSRLQEKGRSEESCEWSLAMAMSSMNLPVFPWINGQCSAQVDYIANLTRHDELFENVTCTLYTAPLTHALRGMKNNRLRGFIVQLLGYLPGKDEFIDVTPVILHFGWLHEKKPFYAFADKIWLKELSDESILDKNPSLYPSFSKFSA